MARAFKTSPFRTRGQIVSTSSTEGESKDEEETSSSSSTTSSSNSEEKIQDKKLEKAKGKRPMQAKRRKQKRKLVLNPYDPVYGPGRAQRGWGKPISCAIISPKGIDVRVCLEFESTNADQKRKGKEKEVEVLQDLETDSEGLCKRIRMESDDDNGPGARI